MLGTLGSRRYGGESVTQLEHALQAAALAQREPASEPLVAAALLHDIGHLLDGAGDDRETGGDDRHEVRSVAFLRGAFVDDLVAPIFVDSEFTPSSSKRRTALLRSSRRRFGRPWRHVPRRLDFDDRTRASVRRKPSSIVATYVATLRIDSVHSAAFPPDAHNAPSSENAVRLHAVTVVAPTDSVPFAALPVRGVVPRRAATSTWSGATGATPRLFGTLPLSSVLRDHARSKRSRFITLVHALTKSWTNCDCPSELP